MTIFELEVFRIFLVVLARVAGLFVSAPILGSGNFPLIGKIGLVGMTAALVTPVLGPLEIPVPSEPLALALFAASDFLLGLAVGFVMTLVFAAVQVGGQIMDLQTGFGMMNVFNPAFETQFPIFGFYLFILAVLVLLATGGHRMMLWALVSTYDTIPPGGLAAQPGLFFEVATWGRHMFFDGLMIAAPVATAMLIAYVVMGLLGRVVPQIHLFIVGFPITIATGLFIAALALGVYVQLLDGMFMDMFKQVDVLIRGLS